MRQQHRLCALKMGVPGQVGVADLRGSSLQGPSMNSGMPTPAVPGPPMASEESPPDAQ